MIKAIKARLLAVFPAIVAILALSAVPAFAEFRSNSSSTAGTTKSGPVVLEGGGATLECAETEGEWKIQTKGQISEHEPDGKQDTGKQVKTTQGPQLFLPIKVFKGCKAKSSSIKEVTPTVGPCTLHLQQQKGANTAFGAVASECKVEIKVLFITCKITVAAANQQTGLNFNLMTNTLINVGANMEIVADDSGISSEAKNCPGVVSTNEAKQKATLLAQGVNWL